MAELASATPRFVATTIDCADLDAMATFWSSLLAVEIRGTQDGYAFLAPPAGSGVALWLQHVPEPRSGKTRIHLDFSAADLDETLMLIERLGGTIGDHQEWHGFVWRQCFDPEGNVFDVMQAAEANGADEA